MKRDIIPAIERALAESHTERDRLFVENQRLREALYAYEPYELVSMNSEAMTAVLAEGDHGTDVIAIVACTALAERICTAQRALYEATDGDDGAECFVAHIRVSSTSTDIVAWNSYRKPSDPPDMSDIRPSKGAP